MYGTMRTFYLALLSFAAIMTAACTASTTFHDISAQLETGEVESAMRRPRDADGEVAGSDAVRQTAQGLEGERQAQEAFRLQVLQALRLQEEGAERRAATALQLLERQDQAIQALRLSLQGVEERLGALVQQLNQTENQGPAANEQLLPHREDNCVKNLEATVKRVLEQLASCESNASIASTSATSNTTSATLAAQPPTPTSTGGTEAAEGEEIERQRVMQRIQDVKAKIEKANATTSKLGEDLCMAANDGNLEEIRRLLDAGVDINFSCGEESGSSPLMAAFRYGLDVSSNSSEVLPLLLERGADVKAVDLEGWTALHYAASNDFSGQGALLLLAAGADVEAREESGWTPLHVAAWKNNEAAARALLAAGARKDLTAWSDNWKGKTPVELTDIDVIRDLLHP